MQPEIRIFEAEPEETSEAILGAAYRTLAKHGYTDLSMARIGEEFEKSTSLIYHHYDTKDELLVDLLEFVLDRIEDQIPLTEQPTPYDQLVFAIEYVTGDLFASEQADVVTTLMELRGQTIHDDRFRQRFSAYNRFLQEWFSEVISAGIESGQFRDVDPEETSEFLLTITEGTTFRHTTTDGVDLSVIQREAKRYVDAHLLAAEQPDETGTAD